MKIKTIKNKDVSNTKETTTKFFGVERWILGTIFALISVTLLVLGVLRAGGAAAAILPLALSIGLFVFALILRMIFTHVSANILKIYGRHIGDAVFLVGTNSLVAVLIGQLVDVVSLPNSIAVIVPIALILIFVFWFIKKVYRVDFVESLAVYGLSSAFFILALILLNIIFRVTLHSAFSGI